MPILTVDRVLLPGERAAVPVTPSSSSSGVEPGVQVGLLYSGAADPRIGVLADVESILPLGGDVIMVSLVSRARVEATPAGDSSVGTVRISERKGTGADRQLPSTKAALRRYLAALAESGRLVNLYPEVPDDPVAGSYAVASLLEISAGERYVLLEVDDAGRRLGLLETILDRERRLLEATMGAKGN